MNDHDFAPLDLVPSQLEELAVGVYRTRLLPEHECARLLGVIDAARAQLAEEGGTVRQPNSMHDHGALIEPLGLGHVVVDLMARLAPQLSHLYPEVGGESLDGHHSYLVEYGEGGDDDLGFHVDDSEVTLNLCLGDQFSGAELVLLGRRCDGHRQSPIRPDETLEIEHEPGFLIVHAGKHRHRVDPIRRGRRRNLIAWLRSGSYRSEPSDTTGCEPWCGLHGAHGSP